uniref:Ig-like domain-containing protein n=1 Tax=Hippocampus comes TaxID=109280 RepID=A0A3Q2XPL3_HIPCM
HHHSGDDDIIFLLHFTMDLLSGAYILLTLRTPWSLSVRPRETLVQCKQAADAAHCTFSWRRNGRYFNVARDPQATMRRHSGTLDIYAWNNAQQYEAEYQCIASNEYGSAYSNKIRLQLYRAPVWPREIVEPVVISAGSSLVLACDPPAGPPFNWPIQTAFPTMHAVQQDRRVSMGVNGDLYFSNVLFNDSTSDFCCSARFPYKNHTLTVTVKGEKCPFTNWPVDCSSN